MGPLSDPIQHFGRYQYAYNNPYRYTDPDGRCPMCIGVPVLVGIGFDAVVQVAGNMADGQGFGDAVSNIDVGDVLAAGAVSAIIPGLGNVAKTGYQGTKAATRAARAIAKVSSKQARTANRAAKNAAAVQRNVEKIEGAVADVGTAAGVATVHQVVKHKVQEHTPNTTVAEVIETVTPPPPPPPPPPTEQMLK